jgi:hypothetical protein
VQQQLVDVPQGAVADQMFAQEAVPVHMKYQNTVEGPQAVLLDEIEQEPVQKQRQLVDVPQGEVGNDIVQDVDEVGVLCVAVLLGEVVGEALVQGPAPRFMKHQAAEIPQFVLVHEIVQELVQEEVEQQ